MSGDPVHRRSSLQDWPTLGGFDPPPPSIDEAKAAFRRGVEAHARGAYTEARAEFLRAADLIPDDAPAPYVASLTELRRIAHDNAAITSAEGGA